MLNRWSIAFLFVAAACGFVACETPEDDAVAQAQQCLDGATTKTAATSCLSKISGNESARANRVRCGIYFLQGGIDKERFKTAYQALKNTGGGSSQTAAMMQNVVLTNSENANIADNLKTACARSGLAGLKRLGDLIYTATQFATLGGADGACFTNPTASCFTTNLSGLDPNSSAGQAVGQTIIDMAGTTCNSTQGTPPDYCAEVNSSIQNCGTPAKVTACMQVKLANPNGTCACP